MAMRPWVEGPDDFERTMSVLGWCDRLKVSGIYAVPDAAHVV